MGRISINLYKYFYSPSILFLSLHSKNLKILTYNMLRNNLHQNLSLNHAFLMKVEGNDLMIV